jgi:hypothetical protein
MGWTGKPVPGPSSRQPYDPIEMEDDDPGTATPYARLEDAC